MDAKEPRPKVKLTGTDGNAFMIIGGCLRVLKAAKLYNEHEITEIREEFKSGDYNQVLQTAIKYCEVD